MAGPTVTLTLAGDSRSIERATRAASDDLTRLGRDAEQAGERMGRATEEGSDRAGAALKAVGAVAAGAGAAAGAMFIGGLDATMDQAASNAKFAAQLGDPAEFERLGGVAGSLYANAYGESLGEVQDAVRAMHLEIGKNAELSTGDMEALTGQAMSLAKAFETEVGEQAKAAGQLLRTGLARDAQHAFDIIARGQQVTASDDLLETLNEYPTAFRNLGLSGEQAIGLMNQGLRAGARDTDQVADALAEFTKLTVDSSDDVKAAFERIGLSGEEMATKVATGGPEAANALQTVMDRLGGIEDQGERARLVMTLFGTPAEDMAQAFNNMNLATAADELGEVAGAAAELDRTLNENDPATKITELQRGFESWQMSLVATSGPLGEVAAGISAFGGDALAIAGNVGMLATALSTMGVGVKIVTAAQWLWNLAMAANPIGLVIIAVAALVGALVWLWHNNETVRAAIGAAWEWIQSAFSTAVDWVGKRIEDLVGWFRNLPGLIGSALAGLANIITWPYRTAFNYIAQAWNNSVGRLSITIPSWVPVIGGNSFSAPKLPMVPSFHDGGIVPGARGQEVLAILQAGERITPADQVGAARAPAAITVRFAGDTDTAFAAAFMGLVRSGRIQLEAA